jgi:Family of unknown function (DUF5755)
MAIKKKRTVIRGGSSNGGQLPSATPTTTTNYIMMIVCGLLLLILWYLYQLYSTVVVGGGGGHSDNSSYPGTQLTSYSNSTIVPIGNTNAYGGWRWPFASPCSSASSSSECHANIFTNPYSPPMNTSHLTAMLPPPIANIPTRGGGMGMGIGIGGASASTSYSQIGILTREHGGDGHGGQPLILPLMGRVLDNARSKYQYYTVSNTGAVNTKLPIRVKGRSCTNEYGCDELYDGDVVYVQGYNEAFKATVYENANFTYMPNIL